MISRNHKKAQNVHAADLAALKEQSKNGLGDLRIVLHIDDITEPLSQLI